MSFFCCSTRTRTQTDRTRICSATITPLSSLHFPKNWNFRGSRELRSLKKACKGTAFLWYVQIFSQLFYKKMQNRCILAVLDDIIRYIARLYLRFVSCKKFLAYLIRTVVPCRIRFPRNIRVSKQIHVHRIAYYRLIQPIRYLPESIVEPDFRHDKIGVEKGYWLLAIGY